jgi:hypothetical protein
MHLEADLSRDAGALDQLAEASECDLAAVRAVRRSDVAGKPPARTKKASYVMSIKFNAWAAGYG